MTDDILLVVGKGREKEVSVQTTCLGCDSCGEKQGNVCEQRFSVGVGMSEMTSDSSSLSIIVAADTNVVY